MTCPLGLICEPDCINAGSCHRWTNPWPLPYDYDPDTGVLVVCIKTAVWSFQYHHHFEDFNFDIAREWVGHGFADAIALPYKYNANGLHVIDPVLDAGFCHPSPLPYRRFRLDDGCWCLHVRHTRSGPADLAGWVPSEPIDLPF